MADDNPTEKSRLDDDAFQRLPEHVKLATLLERERQEKKLAASSKHSASLGVRSAIVSFGLFFVLHVFFVHSILATLLISLAGAGAGYWIIVDDRSHIVAMLVFGAVAILGDMLAYAAGVVLPTEMTFAFFVWLMLDAAALLMVIWAKKHRENPGIHKL